MIGRRRSRMRLASVLGAAVMLATVMALVWIRGGSQRDDGRAPAPLATTSPNASKGHAAPAELPAAARPVLPIAGASLPPVDASADLLGPEAGYFAGVPRAWTAPFTLRGRVVTQDGAPFVGARVLYRPDGMTREIVYQATGTRERGLPSTRTDGEGRFAFRSLRGRPTSALPAFDRDQQAVDVLVIDDRCVASRETCGQTGFHEADIGTLVVSAGCVLRGRVVNTDGHPLAGIRVTCHAAFSLSGDFAECMTDAAGSYEFRGVGPGTGDVRLDQAGWLLASVEVPQGASGELLVAPDLVADAGLAITGSVRDREGHPVPGAVVRVFEGNWKCSDGERWPDAWKSWTSPEAADAVRAGLDGGFHLAGLKNGAHFVLAGAPGFEPTAVKDAWPAGAPVEITLPPEDTAFAERVIRLALVDGRGLPVPGARVLASTWEQGLHSASEEPLEVRRDADTIGHFGIELGGAKDCSATITAPGFGSMRASFTESDLSATDGPRVVLAPEHRLAGVVADDAGVAMPFAWITLRPTGDDDGHRMSTREVSDEAGRFAFTGLGPGVWNVEAFADDAVTEDDLQVTLLEPETDHELTITLHRPCAIEGRLCLEDGSCPPDAENESIDIRRADDEDSSDWTEVRADGSFRYAAPRPGRYVLEGPLGSSAQVEVGRSGVVDVVLVTHAPPIVRGCVLDGDRPVVGARILCTASRDMSSDDVLLPPEFPGQALTDDRGLFTLHADEDGAFDIRALTAAGGSSDVQTVQLAPGAEAAVELHLGTRRAAGVVIDRATRAPVPGVRIGLPGRIAAVTDADGRFAVEGIPENGEELIVRASGWLVPDRVPLAGLSAAAASALTIEVRAVSRIGVILLGPNGLPTPGYVILWRADLAAMPDGKAVQLRGLVDSRECFCELESGRYKLALQIEGSTGWAPQAEDWEARRPDAQIVDLAPGETREIILRVGDQR